MFIIYLTYIWIKLTVFLRENCAEKGANKAVFDALFVLSFAHDVSWNIFFIQQFKIIYNANFYAESGYRMTINYLD